MSWKSCEVEISIASALLSPFRYRSLYPVSSPFRVPRGGGCHRTMMLWGIKQDTWRAFRQSKAISTWVELVHFNWAGRLLGAYYINWSSSVHLKRVCQPESCQSPCHELISERQLREAQPSGYAIMNEEKPKYALWNRRWARMWITVLMVGNHVNA